MDSEKLLSKMKPISYNFDLFGFKIEVFDSVIVMWIVMAIIIILSLILTTNLKKVPTKSQVLVESFVSFINNFTKERVHGHWKSYSAYFGTIFIFLLFSNIISIFNVLPLEKPEFNLYPPTKDIMVTGTMAIMSIFLVLSSSIVIKKPIGFLKSFVQPFALMLPFKILDYLVRPTSLCLRLFGNILAAFTIMELLYLACPIFLPFPAIASIYFDLFDGILQAYIFVFLTSLYIEEAIE